MRRGAEGRSAVVVCLALLAAGCASVQDIAVTAVSPKYRAWKTEGYTHQEYKAWSAVFMSTADASAWRAAGFHAAAAKDFHKTKLGLAYSKGCWEGGVPPHECVQWKALGFDHSQIRGWKKAGFEPSQVRDWRNAGFAEPGPAVSWRNAGFSSAEAKALHDIPIDVARIYKDAGFGPEATRSLRDLPVATAQAFRDSGFSVEETLSWGKVFSPIEAKEFRELGLSESQREELFQVGRDIFLWRQEGFEVGEALAWRKVIGVPARAREWKDGDFSPEAAKRMLVLGALEPKHAKRIAKLCVHAVKPLESLLASAPGADIGECFELSAERSEIVGTEAGLYWTQGKAFYLSFAGSAAAPPERFDGVVKSIGIYRYAGRRQAPKFIVVTRK